MATVTITVLAVNDAPVVAPDTYSTPEDTPLSVAAPGVLINDVDVDGDTLQSSVVSGTSSGTLVLQSNGSFLYTPNTDFTGIDQFTYKVSDGTTESLEVTVTILVGVVNDAPVAQPDNYLVDENGVLVVDAPGVLANDTDVDSNTLTIANVIDGPLHGILSWQPDGSFIYTPNTDFNGTDTFRYQATDGMDNSAPVLVTITVAALNDLPVINPDAYSTNEDTPLAVAAPGVLANDYDVDGDTLSATLVNGTSNGSVALNSRRQLPLHTERELQRRRHVQLQGERRHERHARDDRDDHGQQRERRAGGSTRCVLDARGRNPDNCRLRECWPTTPTTFLLRCRPSSSATWSTAA